MKSIQGRFNYVNYSIIGNDDYTTITIEIFDRINSIKILNCNLLEASFEASKRLVSMGIDADPLKKFSASIASDIISLANKFNGAFKENFNELHKEFYDNRISFSENFYREELENYVPSKEELVFLPM